MRSLGQELVPEVFLGLPQVGRLPGEGGAMHPQEIREEMGVVAPKVGEEFRVFVEPQKRTNDFDGDDFGVAERMTSTSASLCPPTTARNAEPTVVPACVGPLKGGGSYPSRRRPLTNQRKSVDQMAMMRGATVKSRAVLYLTRQKGTPNHSF